LVLPKSRIVFPSTATFAKIKPVRKDANSVRPLLHFYDLGLGHAAIRFCLRASSPALNSVFTELEGLSAYQAVQELTAFEIPFEMIAETGLARLVLDHVTGLELLQGSERLNISWPLLPSEESRLAGKGCVPGTENVERGRDTESGWPLQPVFLPCAICEPSRSLQRLFGL
jgi:hypothetical protein